MNTSLDKSKDYENPDDENSKFWNAFSQTINPVLNNQAHVKFITAGIGVFINIFHFIVLTRKSMRVYTINLFMIGIAICDFLRLLSDVLGALIDYYELYQESFMPQNCIPPETYVVFFVDIYSVTVSMIAQKLAVWFGVAMAILRVIILKYPLSRRAQNLINSSSGITILLIVCLPHLPFWFFDFQLTEIQENGTWMPPSGCKNFSDDSLHTQYSFEHGEDTNETLRFMEGIFFTVIPSIILPIATGFLCYFLKTMKRASTASRSNGSTKMVVLITVTFLISTVPLGINYFVNFLGLNDILGFLIIIFGIFCDFVSTINGTLHFVLCACVSSLYQRTVKEMFGRKKARVATTIL